MQAVTTPRYRSILALVLKAVSLAMFLFHALAVNRVPLDTVQQQIFHIGFAFILVYGLQLEKGRLITKIPYIVLLVVSLADLIYIFVAKDALESRAGLPKPADIVVGLTLMISVIYATYKGWGLALPALVVVAILYALFGSFLPSTIAAPPNKMAYTISVLTTGLAGGVFGSLLLISVLYIFLFIIFGELLGVTGASVIIQEMGKLLSRKVSSGPAWTATVGSAIVGTCTGSAMANVFVVGTITIPMMKAQGMKSEYAGGVEALASTGGQIMPPVMGAAAFVMAYYLGISYWDIVSAAWLPACLYFVACGIGSHLYCTRIGLRARPTERIKDMGLVLRKAVMFLVGLLVLLILMAMRYSPTLAVTASIAAVLLAVFIENLLVREHRVGWRRLVDSIHHGARIGSDIGISMALLGMLVQVFVTTGIGEKLGTVLFDVAGGVVVLELMALGLLALILGCGMPTTAAYVIAAMVAAPPLIRAGLPALAVHMFVFYYAVFSMVTPPVAPASMAASKVANASFFRTGYAAVALGWPAFIVPFGFVFRPELLLKGTISSSLAVFAVCVIVIILLHSAGWGYLKAKLTWLERCLYAVAGIAVLYVVMNASIMTALGLGLVLLFLAWLSQFLKSKRHRGNLPEARSPG